MMMNSKQTCEKLSGCDELKGNDEQKKEKQTLKDVQRSIDLILAVLLLTGQLTIAGVSIVPGGFRISVGGPLTGGLRLEGKSGKKTLNWIIDVMDVITAILLIKDEINFTSTIVSSTSFTVSVSGPIFGIRKQDVSLPDLEKIFKEFELVTSEHFHVNAELMNLLQRGE